ncbi:peptidyl-tRNA hydrolase [Legionella quinlivanii]|uniref:Peptidyl-tRNA hydrolase n=1 Tax=Legionella quinlivanii TaxID=45073 RepID=A0A0W0Y331_9GAMM|nr:aminoacyl-tRNA hydrolase [Legionella quinlivanii]KTD51388.1 peptidyl-tRNA hydrolase [Legionella quinlivanii]SEG12176.1 peptidyl-tRNA hydrolase, PTH1 family [Legionella quinlivanii DSM 21216]STY10148.1 peptidyl-tRNA hydrolase, PTH1 family [Legionella quinlivanii]
MTIKLIIGLRNPGSAYVPTRHNAGAWFVEALAQHFDLAFKTEKKLNAELATLDGRCRLLLPLTFMNNSGLPVREVAQFYRIKPEEILVVHDELDLPAGRIKLKSGGGHGGHNGLRDIIAHLGSQAFHRLRVGIDHPGHKDLVLNYVLGKPSQNDKQLILEAIDRAIQAAPTIIDGNIAAAMNVING